MSGIINLNEWVNDDDRSYEGLAGVPRGDGYEDVMKWDMPAGDSGSTWGYIEYTCRQGSTQKVDVGLSTRSEDAVDSETWRFPCDGEDHAFGVQVHPGGDLDVYTEW